MKAEVIAIDLGSPAADTGRERADKTADSLSGLGIELVSLTRVRPNERDLEDFLSQALKRSRLVILTGGGEDIAKKTLSRILDRRLILHGDLLRHMDELYAATGVPPPAGYEKAALMPHGARALIETSGTSPEPAGFFLEHKARYILYLCAPPGDITAVLPADLLAHLGSRARPRRWRQYRVLRSYGLEEPRLSELLKGSTGKDCSYSLYSGLDGVDIKVAAVSHTLESATAALDDACARISEILGDYRYATGDAGMEHAVAGLLTEKKLKIATAESCTGGLIAKRLTDVPGSTAYMERGVVTYSNLSKVELIGVSDTTLQAYGAVSRETAHEMAEGIRWNAKTDLGISVTGIAGPTGGTPEKPVGLVYIGLAAGDEVTVKKCNFTGGREAVRYATSQRALDMVRRYLLR